MAQKTTDPSGTGDPVLRTTPAQRVEQLKGSPLQSLHTRINLAVSVGRIGIFDIHLPEGLIQANAQMLEIHGLSRSSTSPTADTTMYPLPVEDWLGVIHPDDQNYIKAALEASQSFANPQTVEYRILPHGGGQRHIRLVAQMVQVSHEHPACVLGTALDVTEHHLLTEDLFNKKQRLELATRVSHIGVWKFDHETETVEWDSRMNEIYGIPAEKPHLHLNDWLELIHPEDREHASSAWQEASRKNEVFDAEFRIIQPTTGKLRYIRALALSRRLKAENTPHDYSIGINWDVTKDRLASEELRLAKEAAEAGERAKSEFMATISHEIRTPMNGIMAMAEILLDTPLTEAQKEMVTIMLRSGENLLVILNDILDYSKMEAGKMRLHPAPLSLHTIIHDTVRLLDIQARRKNLELLCRVAPGLDEPLLGDPGRIRQVVTNLVSNAIKFTDEGAVVVNTHMLTSSPKHVTFRIEVRDTGIGIPANVHGQLFKPFRQADQGDRRRFGGSGLGLAISQEIARAMGGSIGFESGEQEGSTFWFDLTLPRFTGEMKTPLIQGHPASTENLAPYRPLRLLLVEDNEANQRVATLLLEQLGHEVRIAANGLVALKTLTRQTFDVVLMDCQMPELDGYETSMRIRAGDVGAKNMDVPIIAITAAGMPGDRERCLEAGMSDYALKPLNRSELSGAFARCGLTLVGRAGHSPAPSASSTPTLEILDLSQIEQLRVLRRPDGNSLLKEIIALVLREMPERFELLQSHIATQDADATAKLAHKMAGSCASIGAQALRQDLSALEKAAKEADWHGMHTATAQSDASWVGLKQRLLQLEY